MKSKPQKKHKFPHARKGSMPPLGHAHPNPPCLTKEEQRMATKVIAIGSAITGSLLTMIFLVPDHVLRHLSPKMKQGEMDAFMRAFADTFAMMQAQNRPPSQQVDVDFGPSPRTGKGKKKPRPSASK